ncbi:hypothetical protein HBB16_11320 [Pseudonocardia sp. MCCB 268]|nr:hypothetical protein [Pseudonocardia cytotoxica]
MLSSGRAALCLLPVRVLRDLWRGELSTRSRSPGSWRELSARCRRRSPPSELVQVLAVSSRPTFALHAWASIGRLHLPAAVGLLAARRGGDRSTVFNTDKGDGPARDVPRAAGRGRLVRRGEPAGSRRTRTEWRRALSAM